MGPEAFSLHEKVALVIGMASPLGRATALALAEAGAHVAVATALPTRREEAAAYACVEEIRGLRRHGFAHTLDTTSEEAVEGLVRRTTATLGPLEILVNAHDLPFAKPLPDVSPGEWQRVLAVNLTGSLLIGFLWETFDRMAVSATMRTFAFVGILGAFTTFSTFSLENLNLLRTGEVRYAITNIALSNGLGLGCVFLGFVASRYLIGLFR